MKLEKNLVEKSNNLISMYECAMAEKMSLTEFRFFCLYLSKLNAREPEKRTVIIPIKDFEKLFDVKVNTTLFTNRIYQILRRTMYIVDEKGKNQIINLYSKFSWYDDTYRDLEITCNYDIVPYLFELKKNYTSYRIANIVKLNSVSKIRLYELAKQYEKIGTIKIDLVELLKIMQSDIAEFKFFNSKVLKPAIADINKYTDVQIFYEKILKCRKVVALKLIIKKQTMKSAITETTTEVESNNELQSLYHKCNKEYTIKQLKYIWDIVSSSGILETAKTTAFNYIFNVYSRTKSSGQEVRSIYKYTLAIISKDAEHSDEKNRLQEVSKPKGEASYDLEDYKDFIRTTKRNMGG